MPAAGVHYKEILYPCLCVVSWCAFLCFYVQIWVSVKASVTVTHDLTNGGCWDS